MTNVAQDEDTQYNRISKKYCEYSEMSSLKRAECYSAFKIIGPLNGKRVLDLACGFGYYTQLLKRRGASQVVGVDISQEMVRLAEERERACPAGVTYQVWNAENLPRIGSFDVITAMYLLNYSSTQEAMLAMFRGAYENLVDGGVLVACTFNPGYTLEKPRGAKYGCCFRSMKFEKDHYVCEGLFMLDPPTPFTTYKWDKEIYEKLSRAAGFRQCTWYPIEPSPEDLAEYGEEYWEDLRENSVGIGLHCKK